MKKNVLLSILGAGLLLVACGQDREGHLVNLSRNVEYKGETQSFVKKVVTEASAGQAEVSQLVKREEGSKEGLSPFSLEFGKRLSKDESSIEDFVKSLLIEGTPYESDAIVITNLDLLNGSLNLT